MVDQTSSLAPQFLSSLSYESLELLVIAILAGTTAFFLGHYAVIRKDKLESIQASKTLFCEMHAIFIRVEQSVQNAILPTTVAYLNQRAEYIQNLIQKRHMGASNPIYRVMPRVHFSEANFREYLAKVDYVDVKMQDVAAKLILVMEAINKLVEQRSRLIEAMRAQFADRTEQSMAMERALFFASKSSPTDVSVASSSEYFDLHVDLRERCNEALFYSYWLLYEISKQHNRKVQKSFVFPTKAKKINEAEILSYGRTLQIDVSRFNGFETQFAKLMN